MKRAKQKVCMGMALAVSTQTLSVDVFAETHPLIKNAQVTHNNHFDYYANINIEVAEYNNYDIVMESPSLTFNTYQKLTNVEYTMMDSKSVTVNEGIINYVEEDIIDDNTQITSGSAVKLTTPTAVQLTTKSAIQLELKEQERIICIPGTYIITFVKDGYQTVELEVIIDSAGTYEVNTLSIENNTQQDALNLPNNIDSNGNVTFNMFSKTLNPPRPNTEQVKIIYNFNNGTNKTTSEVVRQRTNFIIPNCQIKYDSSARIFTGWNTKPDGTGTTYKVGDVVSLDIPANESSVVTLYAQWQMQNSIVKLNSNNPASETIKEFVPLDNTYTLAVPFEYENHTLVEWNTKMDGTGVSYKPNSVITPNTSMNLYAIWAKNLKVNLHNNSNNGTDKIVQQDILKGIPFDIVRNPFIYGKYTFTEWNTQPDGSGTSYVPDADFEPDTILYDNIDLYAQWEAVITYDANDKSGILYPVKLKANGRYTVLEFPSYTNRENPKLYLSYFTEEPDGSGKRYYSGDDLDFLETVTEVVDTNRPDITTEEPRTRVLKYVKSNNSGDLSIVDIAGIKLYAQWELIEEPIEPTETPTEMPPGKEDEEKDTSTATGYIDYSDTDTDSTNSNTNNTNDTNNTDNIEEVKLENSSKFLFNEFIVRAGSSEFITKYPDGTVKHTNAYQKTYIDRITKSTYVSLRGIIDNSLDNVKISWNVDTNSAEVNFVDKDTRIIFKANSSIITVNGVEGQMLSSEGKAVNTQLVNGRLMIPLRYVSELFDLHVSYDNVNKQSTVTTAKGN